MTEPGVVVREVASTGGTNIQPSTSSVPAFIAAAERGPHTRAVVVTSLSQFRRVYGGPTDNGNLFETVNGFFRAAGDGARAYICRVVEDAADTAASRVLDTAGSVDAITVTASSYGLWGNNLSVKVTREDTRVGRLGANLTTADTSATMETLGVARKLRRGDSLLVTNADATTKCRVIVKSVNGKVVTFTAASSFLNGPITAATSHVYVETFSLSVYENARLIYGPVRSLRMSPLSKDYFITVFNGDGTNPEIPVVLTDEEPVGSSTADPRPVNASAEVWGDLLSGAVEGTTYADSDFETALALLDRVEDVRLVSTDGTTGIATTASINQTLLDYCEAAEDITAILNTPPALTPSGAVTFRESVGDSSYGATYYPWLMVVPKEGGPPIPTPPNGYVCGRIVATHRTKGVAKAPAGLVDGRIPGVVGLQGLNPGEDFTSGDASLLNDGLVNLIRMKNGNPTIMGGRTMEAGEVLFLNIRLALNYFKASLKKGSEFAIFEGPTEETFSRIRRSFEGFLLTHWPRDLDGESPDEAFTIVCDSRNNTAETKAQGFTNADVALRVKSTTEVLNINISQLRETALCASTSTCPRSTARARKIR